MNYQKLLQDWVKSKDWEDEVSYDEQTTESAVNFTLDLNEQSFRVFVEGEENRDWLSLYMYTPFNVKNNKTIDALKLFNQIHRGTHYGKLVLSDNGAIQYVQRISLKGVTPDIIIIDEMYSTAIHLFEAWLDDIAAIALTKTTFDEWLEKQEE